MIISKQHYLYLVSLFIYCFAECYGAVRQHNHLALINYYAIGIRRWLQLGSGAIHLGINYSVLNEMKRYE